MTNQVLARQVREERRGNVPLFVHPEWSQRFPWLVQGTTPREAGNFSGFGKQSAPEMHEQWRRLRMETGMTTSVLGRQVHKAGIRTHGALTPGMLFADESDGHTTSVTGILLAVSVADCVPVFIVDDKRKSVAALHAGWRGAAAGIVRDCLRLMGSEVYVHLGPAICGKCYEVGPEVHSALGLSVPDRNTPVDLRAVLAQECVSAGVAADNISVSGYCTRCMDSPFFSHRAGHPERQIGVIGIR